MTPRESYGRGKPRPRMAPIVFITSLVPPAIVALTASW
jgi:hypothetical protein